MKKLAIGILLGVWAIWLMAQTQRAPVAAPSLDSLFPSAPAIYVEARDLGGVVRDWNASPEKAAWLKSDNYTVFSRTRLFQRLGDAQAEFSEAAGFHPDYPFAISIAGGESALAMYDVGKLEMLYITRLAGARVLQTALGKVRSSYESRQSGGHTYYVRENRQTKRSAAFAAVSGLLLLSTREDLMAQALALLSNPQAPSMRGEAWYRNATAASKAQGEIRIAMNMPVLLDAPHFRSYFVQRNISQLRQYSAGIADLFREAAGFREERVFLRNEAAEAKTGSESALARLLALVPADAGFHRGWAQPSTAEVKALLMRKFLAMGSSQGPGEIAPAAAGAVAIAGSEADLETRIDQPALVRETGSYDAAMEALLARYEVQSMLQVQGAKVLPDGVFIVLPAAVALLAQSNWDEAALRAAFPQSRVAVHRAIAIIANDEALLKAITARINSAPADASGSYVADFRHTQELPLFTRQMRLIDAQRAPSEPPAHDQDSINEGREPEFFSGNIPSLGRSLDRYVRVTFVEHDDGDRVPQTVRYITGPTR